MDKEREIKTPDEEPVTGEEIAASEEAAPADAGQEEEKGTARLSWEEILRDPAYKSRYDEAVQAIVKARLRGRAGAEAKLTRLEPVLKALEEDYGLTDESDPAALAALLRQSAGLRRPGGAEIAEHLRTLAVEAEALQQSVPDFDLMREMEDPDFLRLTAPHSGVTLADAYYARHRAERERETAQRSLEAVSRSIRSLGARPKELRETKAGTHAAAEPGRMSRAEREALKKRILEASAQGRHLVPGE